jgi:benzylsuccinate CoA-transferase BbsF subunit
MVSWHCVLAILAALDYRRRTGTGQFIDVSQVEVATALIGEAHLDYTINERVQKPRGNRNPYAAPHGCYRCKGEDRWCAISVENDEEWERFREALGNPEWARDPKFSHTAGRLGNAEELDECVEEWTCRHDPQVIMETLQAAGIAAGNVHRAVDEINDPQLKWNRAIVEIEHPVSGKRLYPASPFRMQQMDFPPDRPAPLLGQHTDEICRDILHLSAEEIHRLKTENILNDATAGQAS